LDIMSLYALPSLWTSIVLLYDFNAISMEYKA